MKFDVNIVKSKLPFFLHFSLTAYEYSPSIELPH